jgi:3'-phosphoadenosine 5'-phosphosulfate sulfotransferase (PAPS reductase)/FAD synthetase
VAASAPAASHRAAAWKKIFSGGASSHVTAHVASLERSPGAMVIHLDNGQVWRQVARASGDLTLRTGDEVTIEEHLGSYWLSARYVSDMQVRQETQ